MKFRHTKALTQLSLTVIFLLILSTLLAACGDNTATAKPEAGKATQAATGSGKTLEIWVMPNTIKPKEDLDALLAEFTAKTGIKVNVTVVDWSNQFTRIQTALTSGVGPDITQMGTTQVGAFAATGGLRPYTDAEIQSMGGSNNFSEAAWSTSHLPGSKDVVAIPWFTDTRVYLYRTDVVKKAGLDPATAFKDWDTMVQSLKKMKDTGMVMSPIAFPGKSAYDVVHSVSPFLWGAGGDWLSADNSKAAFNSEAGVKAFDYLGSLYKEGLVAKEVLDKDTTGIEQMYSNGEVGLFASSAYMVQRAKVPSTQDEKGFSDKVAGQNLGAVMLPQGPSGKATAFLGGSNLAVLKSSKNPAEAVQLVQYLVGKKPIMDYAALTGNLPPTSTALDDPALANDPIYKVFVQAAKTGKAYPTLAAWGPIEEALKKNVGVMWDQLAAGKSFDSVWIKSQLDVSAQEVNGLLSATR